MNRGGEGESLIGMGGPWLLPAAVAALLVIAVAYALTSEGRGTLDHLRTLSAFAPRSATPLRLPTPHPPRPATLFWLAADGLWSVQEQPVASSLPERIEQLCNLVLDRLGLDLLVVQAFVGDDEVAYLFFSVSTWEPSAREECYLVESLTRSILSDLPWLKGVRFVLPSRHLDYSRPIQHFDRGQDPLIHKSRSTLGLEVPP